MEITSICRELVFSQEKPAIKVLLETEFTKEIRILLQKDQEMKEHKTPFPIVIELFEGEIIFGAEGENYQVKKGDILTLSGGIPHYLKAVQDSIIRLTLSKFDSSERVKKVSEK